MLTLRIRTMHSPGDNSEEISLRMKYTGQGAVCSNIYYEVSHWETYIGRNMIN
jgi:hypothetical protein